MMYILGISAYYHDSAACLIKDGEIICAAQEERYTRKKHDASFPSNAIQFCLEFENINGDNIDAVVFYEKPFLKFERLIETYLAFAPRGLTSFAKAIPVWVKDKLFQKRNIIRALKEDVDANVEWEGKLLFSEHHLSHAASAFYPSPFESAAILTLDGVGEYPTTSVSIGSGNHIQIVKEIHFPHSLGLLYSAFTSFCGFKVNSGEYKLMGLAPYGVPKYASLITENLINIAEDGSFWLDMSYFDFATGLKMTSEKFHRLFGGAPRLPESEITQREMDLAASIQYVTESILVRLAEDIARETGQENLCLAGGVALNCVANGILVKKKIFKNVWVQPAAGDAGGAIGAALAAWHLHYRKDRKAHKQNDGMNGSYLGPAYTEQEIRAQLDEVNARYIKLDDEGITNTVAELLAANNAVGWMQGRMEFGPRALGGRSILANPTDNEMQKQLNLKVKYRESFRPFAPSVLYEELTKWFEMDSRSPYMLFVAEVKPEKRFKEADENRNLFGIELLNIPRSTIPAVTHVNYTARIQTVHSDTNPRFHALLKKFESLTGCPMLVNTSFNVRGEPIVCTPTDAFRCFMGTELDVLVIGNFLLYKDEQDLRSNGSYKDEYELD